MLREVEWIKAYSGDFPFYLSLQDQVRRGRTLSEKQLAAIGRAIEREAQPKPAPETFSIQPGQVLIVGKFVAQRIAEENRLTRPHHAFEVVQVHRETRKAYHVTARLSAQRTSYCGICGLTLKNPESVAAGIGPICAEKLGIFFGDRSLEELSQALKVEREITAWIAKASIKNLKKTEEENA